MAELTYRRGRTDSIPVLRAFVEANFRRKSVGTVGCLEEQRSEWMTRMLDRDDISYVVAEDNGTLVGVYAVQVHPASQPGVHLRVISLALSPDFDQDALYFNMNVALMEHVNWPGCCQNSWTAVMPPGAALDYIASTAFGEGMTIEPFLDKPLVYVTARKPPVDVPHTDVPRV